MEPLAHHMQRQQENTLFRVYTFYEDVNIVASPVMETLKQRSTVQSYAANIKNVVECTQLACQELERNPDKLTRQILLTSASSLILRFGMKLQCNQNLIYQSAFWRLCERYEPIPALVLLELSAQRVLFDVLLQQLLVEERAVAFAKLMCGCGQREQLGWLLAFLQRHAAAVGLPARAALHGLRFELLDRPQQVEFSRVLETLE